MYAQSKRKKSVLRTILSLILFSVVIIVITISIFSPWISNLNYQLSRSKRTADYWHTHDDMVELNEASSREELERIWDYCGNEYKERLIVDDAFMCYDNVYALYH